MTKNSVNGTTADSNVVLINARRAYLVPLAVWGVGLASSVSGIVDGYISTSAIMTIVGFLTAMWLFGGRSASYAFSYRRDPDRQSRMPVYIGIALIAISLLKIAYVWRTFDIDDLVMARTFYVQREMYVPVAFRFFDALLLYMVAMRAVRWKLDKTLAAAIPLVLVFTALVISTATTGARGAVLYGVLNVMAAQLLFGRRVAATKILAVTSAFVLFVLLLSQLRTQEGGTATFLYSNYVVTSRGEPLMRVSPELVSMLHYLAAPIYGLSDWFESTSHGYSYGSHYFAGIMKIAGGVVGSDAGYWSTSDYSVVYTPAPTVVFTALREAMDDFGWLGLTVVIMSLLAIKKASEYAQRKHCMLTSLTLITLFSSYFSMSLFASVYAFTPNILVLALCAGGFVIERNRWLGGGIRVFRATVPDRN